MLHTIILLSFLLVLLLRGHFHLSKMGGKDGSKCAGHLNG